jgi:hypothetical protein
MIYHIMCEVVPGKEDVLDAFLIGKMKNFWLANQGVSRFHVFGDHLANKLERVVTIEVGDFSNFEKILALDERKALRNELMTLASNVQSRIMEVIE